MDDEKKDTETTGGTDDDLECEEIMNNPQIKELLEGMDKGGTLIIGENTRIERNGTKGIGHAIMLLVGVVMTILIAAVMTLLGGDRVFPPCPESLEMPRPVKCPVCPRVECCKPSLPVEEACKLLKTGIISGCFEGAPRDIHGYAPERFLVDNCGMTKDEVYGL